MHLFGSLDCKIVTQCQFYTGYLPVEHLINLRRATFLISLKLSPCSSMRALYELSAQHELLYLANLYKVSENDFILNSHDVIKDHFINNCNLLVPV